MAGRKEYRQPIPRLGELGGDPCWLGSRDSNPGTVIQSHVSYR